MGEVREVLRRFLLAAEIATTITFKPRTAELQAEVECWLLEGGRISRARPFRARPFSKRSRIRARARARVFLSRP